MNAMSIKEFNANTSKALSRAAAGEVITLTKDGEPFVRIEPVKTRPKRGTPEWQAAYERMMEMMKRGAPLGGRASYEERTE